MPAPRTAPPSLGGPTTTRRPAVGAAGRDDLYLAQRLTYTPFGTDFDPISNRDYFRVALMRAVVFWLVWVLGSLVIFLVFGIAGVAQAASDAKMYADDYGNVQTSSGGSEVLLYLWFAFGTIWTLGIWAFFWLTRIPVLLSEWMLTVDGAAGAARTVLDHVHASIRDRRPPTDSPSFVQVTPEGRSPRLYVQLVDRTYMGFVSSFPVGTDLFLGWTFWLNQSPLRWAWAVLVRAFRAVMLRSSALHDSLGFDDAKALREVMHSSVRMGVDVAAATFAGPGAGSGR